MFAFCVVSASYVNPTVCGVTVSHEYCYKKSMLVHKTKGPVDLKVTVDKDYKMRAVVLKKRNESSTR